MAEGKTSFVMYCDYIHTFNELTDDEAGKLIKHILSYVNDLNPVTDDKIIKIVFEPIKQQLKRDLKEWETIRVKRSQAGTISANKRKQASTHVNDSKDGLTHSTVNGTVTVTANGNETDFINKMVETFFRDLPNSVVYEKIAMDLKTTTEVLNQKLLQFRHKCNVMYPNFLAFCNHFKKWVNLELKTKPELNKKRNQPT